jgi:hypothetical protein
LSTNNLRKKGGKGKEKESDNREKERVMQNIRKTFEMWRGAIETQKEIESSLSLLPWVSKERERDGW